MSVDFGGKFFVSIRDGGEFDQLSTFRGGPDLSRGPQFALVESKKRRTLVAFRTTLQRGRKSPG